ncbi:DUF4230 domain-containing protein [Prevotella sp. KH2C16]|uniref:DUF4230 domain-containing protein n=1 Tax=Prevotella sp. KH2C16 TaxID=1855325 RepID=UPI0008F3F658|nr:DUF4230 domain-containing protein [Prevotella sp. KH2C16]SFG15879.1 Protein of unknown function [Prevotella sp. KH2C16]
MEKQTNNFWDTLKWLITRISITAWMIIASAILIVIAVVFALAWLNHDNHFSLSTNDSINITSTQIKSIENIGEWEFLSISDEELVDTISRGFFGDSELVRIYYGTLRLGVNLHKVKPGWITTHKDTVVATLPAIELLDNDFIDEAKTQSFYESGTWSQADRKALYEKAYRAMRQRCMNPKNIEIAEKNAALQFDNLLRSMGFEFTRIKFDKPEKK